MNIKRKGQTIIEIVLAMGLTSILLPALLTGLVASRTGQPNARQRTTAVALVTESFEAVRVVRARGWTTFAVNGTYHPVPSSGTWTLVPGTQVIGDFVRSLTIADVRRNSSGEIVTTGGNLDPSTKLITHTVSWSVPMPASVSFSAYLTRYLENDAYIQTTEAEFLTGARIGTTITNTAGGEVALSSGGTGQWCDPNLSITALDLPNQGVANALTAIEGRAFAGTGENASGISFADVFIANTNPPSASITGTFDGFKTNDIFGESNGYGEYAYLATDTNDKEIEIIALSASPYTEAGYFDAAGQADANSVYVTGNVGYMTQNNIFRTFDLSSRSGSRPQLGALTLAGTGTKVIVVGNYAFVSVSGSSGTEMQILDVTNPASLAVVGQANVDGTDGRDVYINLSATRAYLATSASSSQREMFILDISTKTGDRPVLGSYEASGMSPKGITVVPGNKAVLVGTGGQEYQVINITDESAPAECGGLNIDTGVNGVASVIEADGDAYSYIITGDAGTELKIIEGGPGGKYSTSGSYESATFDLGYQLAFNRFFANYIRPDQSDINFQVAVADAGSDGCNDAGFVFVGPDGTSGTFFTSPAAIPFSDDGIGYENPGRCFRYKVFFSTTDQNATPVFYDVSVNYSP
ncbi:hypothetical protein A2379_04215 [Candidatus Amesbacteria bacterium RIFOXYB1_FULL_47_13]|nr:MAG: hypothetical protein A2379_04215 [Candidatus Amesbacteria bacterium RIFOXYB1_FULL_47_13]HBC72726.1 hypothetical protein [Candidatus Amesbacteria bacterium]